MKRKLSAFLVLAFFVVITGCSSPSDDAKSANADLSALGVSRGTLTPAFSAAVKSYTVCVSNVVDSITVTAEKSDPKATISIDSAQPAALTVGNNAITVTVTAEDGTANEYTVTVTRNPVISVGAIFPGSTIRWPMDIAGLKAGASDTGTSVIISEVTSTATQIGSFNKMVSDGIKYILLTAIDGSAPEWAGALQSAHTAGVTVIAYDRYIKDADLFFSFDNTDIGRMQGRWLVSKIPAGLYYVLSGASADDNSALFKSGALEIINAHGGITCDTAEVTDWDKAVAKTLVAAYLSGKTPNAILAPNDWTAEGVAEEIAASSLTTTEKTGLYAALTGQDGELAAYKRIYAGKQGMTIGKNTYYLSKWSLSICSDMATGKKVADLANNSYKSLPAFLLTNAIDTKAIYQVDGTNLESLAKAGSLSFTWSEITAP